MIYLVMKKHILAINIADKSPNMAEYFISIFISNFVGGQDLL